MGVTAYGSARPNPNLSDSSELIVRYYPSLPLEGGRPAAFPLGQRRNPHLK
jgi:hypothetical protein